MHEVSKRAALSAEAASTLQLSLDQASKRAEESAAEAKAAKEARASAEQAIKAERTQQRELQDAHSDLLVLLASQEIEKKALQEHLGRHGPEAVQEAMKSAFDNGALDFTAGNTASDS